MLLFLKVFSVIANSVDPNQTIPLTYLCWHRFAYAILSETLVYVILGHLPYCYKVLKGKSLHFLLIFFLEKYGLEMIKKNVKLNFLGRRKQEKMSCNIFIPVLKYK